MSWFDFLNDEVILILLFFFVFVFVYVPLSYMMRKREQKNHALVIVVSICISLLSVLFVSDNVISMLVVSRIFLFLPFLGLGFVILSSLNIVGSTNRDKWLIIIIIGFLIFIYWLVAFKFGSYEYHNLAGCYCICD